MKRWNRLREIVKNEGVGGSARVVGRYLLWRLRGRSTGRDEYTLWAEAAEEVRPPHSDDTVGFSIVMPVYNTHPEFLSAAVESVLNQTHRKWQLVMVDDASTNRETVRVARRLADSDARIVLVEAERNGGIAAATNIGIGEATHEWTAFMDHDDVLHKDALTWFSGSAQEAHLIYSDEDKIDAVGRRYSPTWKPAWSARLLLSINYVNHLTAVRTNILKQLGGLREGYDGAQDHDLMIRFSEIPNIRVAHIPHVLYHWRIWEGSFSQSTESKLAAETSGLAAVADAIERRRWHAESTLSTGTPYNYRVRFNEATDCPSVKVIIPTRDRVRLLNRCVAGVLQRTDGVDLHLVIVDNGSVKPSTLDYLDSLEKRENVTVIRIDDEFNYSVLCNRGAEAGPETDFLLMLNNDTEVHGRKWLQQMTGWLLADDSVCCVGAKLLYADGAVQHGGVVLGLGGVAGHYADGEDDAPRLNNHHDQAREVTAVTGAVLLVRTGDFAAVGGFREEMPLVYQDTDFCMRLSAKTGGSVLYDPTYALSHLGSATRSARSPEQAYGVHRFDLLWGDEVRRGDEFYSPHVSLETPDFALRELPRDGNAFARRFTPRLSKPPAKGTG